MFSTESDSSYGSAVGWCPTSDALLRQTESTLLSVVRSEIQEEMVDIGPIISNTGDQVLTRSANTKSPKTPLVLIHGFASGSPLWCLNIDHLAEDRPLYFFDLVGFGRSSRPDFSSDPAEVEEQFMNAIDAWRKVMGLKTFYLLGHSFGGYLSIQYAMKYPHRVEHLILVDPWGFPERPPDHKLPLWVRPIEFGSAFVLPFFVLRAGGPLGYFYLQVLPPIDTRKFPSSMENASMAAAMYSYHTNVKKPSGEAAFHTLMLGLAWAKRPILPRIHQLKKEVPMTILYGKKTWIWKRSGYQIKSIRENSYVDVKVVPGAGHLVYTEQPERFNAIVSELLKGADCGRIPTNSLTRATPLPLDIRGNSQLMLAIDDDTDSEEYLKGVYDDSDDEYNGLLMKKIKEEHIHSDLDTSSEFEESLNEETLFDKMKLPTVSKLHARFYKFIRHNTVAR